MSKQFKLLIDEELKGNITVYRNATLKSILDYLKTYLTNQNRDPKYYNIDIYLTRNKKIIVDPKFFNYRLSGNWNEITDPYFVLTETDDGRLSHVEKEMKSDTSWMTGIREVIDLKNMGKGKKALQTAKKWLTRFPNNYFLLSSLNLVLTELGKYDQALQESDRLIQMFPTVSLGYIDKANVLMELKRKKEAYQTYKEGEKKLANDKRGLKKILTWHGRDLFEDGQFKKALSVINRALKLPGEEHQEELIKMKSIITNK